MILACTIDGGIGENNTMPWYIPEEIKKFKKITSRTSNPNLKNAVIMGRNTWESLGKKELPNRINIVLSKSLKRQNIGNILIRNSINDCLITCCKYKVENIFIIGGAKLYDYFLKYHCNTIQPCIIDKIYLSVMFHNNTHSTDTYIELDRIFESFVLEKDKEFEKEARERLFASYICFLKCLE